MAEPRHCPCTALTAHESQKRFVVFLRSFDPGAWSSYSSCVGLGTIPKGERQQFMLVSLAMQNAGLSWLLQLADLLACKLVELHVHYRC